MKKKIFPLLIVFIMCFAGVLALQIFLGRPNAGAQVQDAELYERLFYTERYVTPEGGLIRLKDIKAPVVVVMFWASWCLPCVGEFKELVEFQKKYSEDQVFFLGVNQDTEEPMKALEKFRRDFPLRISYLLDEQGFISKNFGVEKLPTSFIFVNGTIVQRVDGPIEFQTEPWTQWLGQN